MDTAQYIDKLAYVIKSTPASRQITDPFEHLYTEGRAIEPPLPPGALLQLLEENPIHAACIAAKVDDAVGRGWTVEDGDEKQWQERLENITPDATWSEVLRAVVRDFIAIGWGALEVVRVGSDIGAEHFCRRTHCASRPTASSCNSAARLRERLRRGTAAQVMSAKLSTSGP